MRELLWVALISQAPISKGNLFPSGEFEDVLSVVKVDFDFFCRMVKSSCIVKKAAEGQSCPDGNRTWAVCGGSGSLASE